MLIAVVGWVETAVVVWTRVVARVDWEVVVKVEVRTVREVEVMVWPGWGGVLVDDSCVLLLWCHAWLDKGYEPAIVLTAVVVAVKAVV